MSGKFVLQNDKVNCKGTLLKKKTFQCTGEYRSDIAKVERMGTARNMHITEKDQTSVADCHNVQSIRIAQFELVVNVTKNTSKVTRTHFD